MDIDEKGVAEIALIENLQRKDLNVWEEADGLAALAQKFGYTQEQIAQKISKSRSTVTEFMTIAGLPQEIRERCKLAKIGSKATLLEIARQFDEAAMFAYLDDLQADRKTKRSSSTPPKKQKLGEIRTHDSRETDNSADGAFTFTPETSEFELKLLFRLSPHPTRPEVLKALKTAFDAVKSGQANI
jgi:ParB family chromosome partitioning protein